MSVYTPMSIVVQPALTILTQSEIAGLSIMMLNIVTDITVGLRESLNTTVMKFTSAVTRIYD